MDDADIDELQRLMFAIANHAEDALVDVTKQLMHPLGEGHHTGLLLSQYRVLNLHVAIVHNVLDMIQRFEDPERIKRAMWFLMITRVYNKSRGMGKAYCEDLQKLTRLIHRFRIAREDPLEGTSLKLPPPWKAMKPEGST